MTSRSHRVEILQRLAGDGGSILTRDALELVGDLHRRFNGRRRELLAARGVRACAIAGGAEPRFLEETAEVRAGSWTVAAAPADLDRRWVEITGPVDRKMMINALNSGADVFMADFEDALSPTWTNVVQGQINLIEAVRRRIDFQSPDGREYRLDPAVATLVVRPRGWHLDEKHVHVDGEPVSASLFDFGLYLFHNAQELLARGSGPYFYLPKLESHLEARLWNDVFCAAQDALGIPHGTIRATVLIETILAAFEMDEILYELRQHAAGLNAGRWDYIFSAIKKFAFRDDLALPDRGQITMTVPFMRAYTELLVETCHRRGAHAIGGMAAFIPSRRDEEVNRIALAKVREDKEREAADGFDGSWVAHPDLVPVCREVFERVLGGENHQKHRLREDVDVSAERLVDLTVPGGELTEEGVRSNVSVGIQYLRSWLEGNGAAAINNLMEDAATAEISRAQLWQWVHRRAKIADGRTMSPELFAQIRDEEIEKLGGRAQGKVALAAELLDRLVLAEDFKEFLTLDAYRHLE
jgi:malate synthase